MAAVRIPLVPDSPAIQVSLVPPFLQKYVEMMGWDDLNWLEDVHMGYEEGRPVIHTNTVEGYFSLFKRGMRGTYQHCAKRHLHRYLAEFDFRYSNRIALGVDDQDRAEKALAGATGKRLYYRQPSH